MGFSKRFYVNCTDKIDILNITADVKRAVREAGISNGILLISVPISAAGIALLENDPEIHKAFRDLVVRLVPDVEGKRPERRSKTGKVDAHLRGLLMGATLSLSVLDSSLAIGPWQEVILYDFDDRVGRREFLIQVIDGGKGEATAGRGSQGVPLGQMQMA